MEQIKIGEIKLHSIMLICPEVEISYDEDSEASLVNTLDSLRCDPNVRDIVLGIVPAINRAFSLIEKRGGTGKKSAKYTLINPEKIGNRTKIAINKIAHDILSISKVYYSDGTEILFDIECDNEIYIHSQKEGEYTFIYNTKINRISESSYDFDDVELDDSIAGIIPYFVKSELIASENSEEAKASRLLFDGALCELASIKHGNSTQSVQALYFYE